MFRRKLPRSCLLPMLLAGAGLLQWGCVASIKESYYLEALDPKTGVVNFFRINLNGNTNFSRSKYSIGFYDRESVERLFGERSIQQEFLANRLEVLSAETDKELKELQTTLDKTHSLQQDTRKERLQVASGTVAGLIERYQTRFDGTPELSRLWTPSLQRARTALGEGDTALKATPPDLDGAERHIREAQVILETIRIAVDGSVLVRFFDGAGNEIDTTTKTLVIFVASDASRFTEALRQLAESEEAKQNLLMAVLGSKIQESELAAKRVLTSDTQLTPVNKRLSDIVTEVKGFPAARTGDDAAKEKARKEELAKLKAKILESATAASSRGFDFKNADEIRNFAAGLGDGQ